MRTFITLYLLITLSLVPAVYAQEDGITAALSSVPPPATGARSADVVFRPDARRIGAVVSVRTDRKTRLYIYWYAPDEGLYASTVRLAFPSPGLETASTSDFIDGPFHTGWWRLEVKSGEETLSRKFLVTDNNAVLTVAYGDKPSRIITVRALNSGVSNYEDVIGLASSDNDPDVRAEAVEAAVRTDFKDIEPLIDRASTDDAEKVRAAAARAALNLPDAGREEILARLSGDASDMVRREAADALGYTGVSFSAGLLGGLIADEDAKVREAAFSTLSGLKGAEAVEALSRGFSVEDTAFRQRVLAEILARSGPGRAMALTAALGDRDPRIRMSALKGLAEEGSGWQTKKVLPLVDDPDENIALKAYFILLKAGEEAALDEGIKSRHPAIRKAAVKRCIRVDGPSMPGRLMAAVKDDDPDIRRVAVEALAGLGDEGAPGLAAALDDTQPDIRITAAGALAETKAPGAEDAMLGSLHDEDAEVRRLSVLYFANLGGPEKYGVMEGAATDENPSVRAEGLAALLADADKRSSRALGVYYHTGGAKDRYAVIKELSGRKDGFAAAVLKDALDDEDEDIRLMAVNALGGMGHAAELVRLVLDTDREVRMAALRVLEYGHDPEAVVYLAKSLKDTDPAERAAALRALFGIKGPEAGRAISSALDDGSEDVRELAIRLTLTRDDMGALEGLTAILDDPRPKVRSSAVAALVGLKGEGVDAKLMDVLGSGSRRAGKAAFEALVGRGSARLPEAVLFAFSGGGAGDALDPSEPAARKALDRVLDPPDKRMLPVYERFFAAGYRRADILRVVSGMQGEDATRIIGDMYRQSGGDEGLRLAAVKAIASRGVDAMPALNYAIDDPSPHVRLEAVRAIAGLGDGKNTQEALSRALKDEDPEIRAEALDGLSGLHGPDAVLRMLPALDDADLKDKALSYIAAVLEPGVVESVDGSLYKVQDASARAAMLRMLADKGLATRLIYQFIKDPSGEVRSAVISLLGSRGAKDGAYWLLMAGTSLQPGVREMASDALLGLDTGQIRAGLDAHFDDDTAEAGLLGFAADSITDGPLLKAMVDRVPAGDTRRLGALMEPLMIRLGPQDTGPLLDGLKAEDPELRREILGALAGLGRDEAVAALTRAMQQYQGLGRDILEVSSRKGLAVDMAAAALRVGDTATRVVATGALGGLSCDRTEPVLIAALRDAQAAVRLSAARAAQKAGCEAALLAAAGDVSDEVRLAAAEGLGGQADKACVDALGRLALDTDQDVRSAATGSLLGLGDAVPEGIWTMLASKARPGDTRLAALGALSAQGEETSAPIFAEALAEADERISQAGADGIAALGAQALVYVYPLLDRPEVRDRALDVIGRVADPSCETKLAALLPELEGASLLKAVETLGRLGSSASLRPLSRVYEGGDVRTKTSVLRALAGLRLSGDEPALMDLLKKALEEPDDSLRFYAARTTGELRVTGLRDALETALSGEASKLVSAELRKALERL